VTESRRLRVVEVAGGAAGAVCSRLFAGLGHDVTRLEPPTGDPLSRQQPLNDDGVSLGFVALNADKRRESMPPSDEGADQTVLERAAGAEVVVVDRSSGPDGSRLTPELLRDGRPELIVVWITGFGIDGEYGDLMCDSLLAECYGGLATMIGDPADRPLALGDEQAAYCTGIAGFLGAMLALRRRDRGFGGDVVDVAMSDVVAYMDWKSDVGLTQTGVAPRRSGPHPGDWSLVRAKDGWVGWIFQQEHWDSVISLVGSPALADPDLRDPVARAGRADEWWPVIESWASSRSAKEIYRAAQELGLPFGWVCRSDDLAAAEQLRSRGFLADAFDGRGPAVTGPVHADRLQWRTGRLHELTPKQADEGDASRNARASAVPRTPDVRSADTSPGPLDGVIVLDFGTITAGAAVTRLLADYGATVVKVESPTRPDTFRRWKTTANSPTAPASPYFAPNNVGKLSLAIDLKTDAGKEVVHALAERCHVLVENFRVGVTRRLGIDAATVHAINPELVYLSLSSQGQTGPDAEHTSYGSTLDLLSGLASVTGYPPDQPRWSSSDVNYPDQIVAFFGAALVAYGVQFAPGAWLDVSQREVVSWTLAAEIAEFLLHGVVSSPQGNRRPGRSPHDTYPCREDDTWVALSCATDAQRVALAQLIGADALVEHGEPWWAENADRVDRHVREWTRGRSRDDVVRALRAAGVPAVPVLDAADRAKVDHFVERGVATYGTDGPLKGAPFRMQGYAAPHNLTAPPLGQHTRQVLTELGGKSDADVDRLEALGVVLCRS
jgi:crotonobetainyl-CoA:carnitine CoA-transferase CaiB-like acyl-CoA transferase